MRFSQEETSIENLRALCLRWNRAAGTFCAGSEYIDDPERVFARIREQIQFGEKIAHRKGELSLTYKSVDGTAVSTNHGLDCACSVCTAFRDVVFGI